MADRSEMKAFLFEVVGGAEVGRIADELLCELHI